MIRKGVTTNTMGLIEYEFPLSERIRSFLRLESMFIKLDHHIAENHPFAHHNAILNLFEIIENGSRADLKSEVLQELERQKQLLSNTASVATQTLDANTNDLLQKLTLVAHQLGSLEGRLGQDLRDNEWLRLIQNRNSITGGVCAFDLPSYHAWQQQPTEKRRQWLMTWAEPLQPLAIAIKSLLKILRQSGQNESHEAKAGSFTQNLSGKTFQLARIRLDQSLELIPELSANKHMIWIRFNQQGQFKETKNPQAEKSLDFELRLCRF
jgi:cell division protein ZapD